MAIASSARRAVFATGYETPEFLDQSITRLVSTYAIATEPLERGDGLGRRPLPHLGDRPPVLLRAHDQRTDVSSRAAPTRPSPRPTSAPTARAADRESWRSSFATFFPDIAFGVDWRWAGTFGETKDGLPYIGTTRQFPNGYFALGYGGNGITFSWIAAGILLDLFLGHENENAELFGFDR